MSSTPLTAVEPGADLRAVEALARARSAIAEQIEKRVVGQREVVEHLLIALSSPADTASSWASPALRRRCSSRPSPRC